jgi:hypothetical protein
LELGLISTSPTSVKIAVESTKVYPYSVQFTKLPHLSPGRPSVRLQSKKTYTHALYVLDANHMPTGCGTWPAFWSLGGGVTWPQNGEIDIIEVANKDTNNKMTLHTAPNCTESGFYETGELITNNCANPPSGAGCTVKDLRSTSAGPGFNAIGGGVYVMEWTSYFIRIWFFPRHSIPDSIHRGIPDPDSFGPAINIFEPPAANFMPTDNATCDIDSRFKDHNIIINIDLCGDLGAGPEGTSGIGEFYAATDCPQLPNTNGSFSCGTFVGNNPGAFTEAYWSINSLKVYVQSQEPPYIGPFPTGPEPALNPPGWYYPGMGQGGAGEAGPGTSVYLGMPSAEASYSAQWYPGPNTWTGDRQEPTPS